MCWALIPRLKDRCIRRNGGIYFDLPEQVNRRRRPGKIATAQTIFPAPIIEHSVLDPSLVKLMSQGAERLLPPIKLQNLRVEKI